ncbi:transcriptional regulator, XRE family [Parvibaculum lavamentivorans DS-1]|uniref:Transcriptional regulator, XRE family n=1 Tax=Parvibaculum lavamentivorans (strain DS-1 / DSM 13023 / NCIMB 13966) TaxID=402881 RepID=A7HRF8_PARL1|nr:transcriptional regulator, XRE family [Parvibaculum lavamentivorans DS-1]
MTKTSHQKILGADGEALFVLVPAADYEKLRRAADDIEDLRAAGATLALGSEGPAPVPAIVAHRIADGENPVRVWREYRGMKAIELARAAGMSAPYLSEIETGKKDGTFRTMAGIAEVLRVSLDDLAPPADEEGRRARERAALIDGVRAQIRKLVALVTGPVDFNTAAVRRAVTTLAADAVALKAQDRSLDGWLDDVLEGVRAVLDLVDRAEGDIIGTARQARRELEEIVSGENFTPLANAARIEPMPDLAAPDLDWRAPSAAE